LQDCGVATMQIKNVKFSHLLGLRDKLRQLRIDFRKEERKLDDEFQRTAKKIVQEKVPVGTKFKFKERSYNSFEVTEILRVEGDLFHDTLTVEEFLTRHVILTYRMLDSEGNHVQGTNLINLQQFFGKCEIVGSGTTSN